MCGSAATPHAGRVRALSWTASRTEHRVGVGNHQPQHPPSTSTPNSTKNHPDQLQTPPPLAATITQRLAHHHRTQPTTSLPDLAASLNNLAIRLGDLDRREEALAAITQAIDIRRDLAVRQSTVENWRGHGRCFVGLKVCRTVLIRPVGAGASDGFGLASVLYP